MQTTLEDQLKDPCLRKYKTQNVSTHTHQQTKQAKGSTKRIPKSNV